MFETVRVVFLNDDLICRLNYVLCSAVKSLLCGYLGRSYSKID